MRTLLRQYKDLNNLTPNDGDPHKEYKQRLQAATQKVIQQVNLCQKLEGRNSTLQSTPAAGGPVASSSVGGGQRSAPATAHAASAVTKRLNTQTSNLSEPADSEKPGALSE